MEAVFSWIRNLVCGLCLFQIFMQLLPEGNFRKYVRFFCGLLLLLLVFGPLMEAAHMAERFEKAWRLESLREQAREIRREAEGMEELRSGKIREACRGELERQIEETARALGVSLERAEVDFSDAEGCELQVAGVSLQVEEAEEQGQKLSAIKKELLEVYQIPAEHITISIQE